MVTSSVVVFFFKFLEWKGYKVTKVAEVTQMFFFKQNIFSEVTRLQGYEGYKVTRLQNPLYILPLLSRGAAVRRVYFCLTRTSMSLYPIE